MKKSLIALAALAATASFAQSTVSITGLFDVGVSSIDYKGNKVATTGGINGSATSFIALAGTEDLGSGLKAEFRWENAIDPANTANRTAGTAATGTASNVTTFLGNGNTFVGLNGNFGAVKFGSPNSATLSINGEGNNGFATAIGSGYRVTSFDAVRFQNSTRYDTPTFGGFSGSLLYSAKNDKQANVGTVGLTGNLQNQSEGRDQVSELGLAYVNGPLSARYAHLQVSQYANVALPSSASDAFSAPTSWTRPTGAAFKLDSLSVNYGVTSALKLAYFYQAAKSDALTAANSTTAITTNLVYDRKTNGVSAAYTISPALTAMVNYQQVKNGAAATSAGGVGQDGLSAKVLGLGVDYALSKRTNLYARYERDSDNGTAGFRSITGYTAATGNTTYIATAVGVRHTF